MPDAGKVILDVYGCHVHSGSMLISSRLCCHVAGIAYSVSNETFYHTLSLERVLAERGLPDGQA
jgi:hypothetical protein